MTSHWPRTKRERPTQHALCTRQTSSSLFLSFFLVVPVNKKFNATTSPSSPLPPPSPFAAPAAAAVADDADDLISKTMQIHSPRVPLHGPVPRRFSDRPLPSLRPPLCPRPPRFPTARVPSSWRFLEARPARDRFVAACVSPSHEIAEDEAETTPAPAASDDDAPLAPPPPSFGEEAVARVEAAEKSGFSDQSLWGQMKEIMVFAGPATGLWICGPLMSLIDTVVIGQESSIQLAALGPGTVLCDYMSYVFMFLSIATSNMVATSLARQDKDGVQHQISILLFLGLTCGFLMLFFTKFFGSWALTAFAGAKNMHIVPAANTYVQIRGLAWPALLIGWVAQSASLGMKDSWGPLKALAVASAINGIGDIVLCSMLGYGIAGAAWATMASQVVAGYMMMAALNKKGYNAFTISVPSADELLSILALAAPVFVTMISKVAFYSLLTYFATSMGTITVAAHQVMVQTFCMCTVWGEPLSQTAQSFMPELIYGVNRSLEKARTLLKSLVIIGCIVGIILGSIGTFVPWKFPNIFTPDQNVIQEMHKVLIPYFMALAITPPTHSLEGTLLAGRDLRFISASMSGCFTLGSLLLLLVSSKGLGLAGCWYALSGFQWARFFLALRRLTSANSVLHTEDLSRSKVQKLKAT